MKSRPRSRLSQDQEKRHGVHAGMNCRGTKASRWDVSEELRTTKTRTCLQSFNTNIHTQYIKVGYIVTSVMLFCIHWLWSTLFSMGIVETQHGCPRTSQWIRSLDRSFCLTPPSKSIKPTFSPIVRLNVSIHRSIELLLCIFFLAICVCKLLSQLSDRSTNRQMEACNIKLVKQH